MSLSGISHPFERLFRAQGQVNHVLLTRSPLYLPRRAFTFDLHVLDPPPAFALSQDQTLQSKIGKIIFQLIILAYVCMSLSLSSHSFQACYSVFKDQLFFSATSPFVRRRSSL